MMGGFLNSNNNTTLKYKDSGGSLEKWWGLPFPTIVGGSQQKNLLTLVKLEKWCGLPKEMMGAS